MPIYFIRAITKSDSESWLLLRNKLWEGDDHAAEIDKYFAGEADEPNEVLLAFDECGKAIAHIELSLRQDIAGLEGVKTGYIEGLYIEPEHRRTGLALQLLRASESWASHQGCKAFASDREDRVIVRTNFLKRLGK